MSAVLSRSLSGAVALVTGGGGGLGHAMCAALAEAGARVMVTDLADPPKDSKADAWSRHDVTSADDWARIMEEVRQKFGRLDCLVNNAGIAFLSTIADLKLEQWRHVMNVNVESVLLGMQAALPLLRESGKDRHGGSSIVNVASIASLRGGAYNASYGTSKAAVAMLTKCAAKEFAAFKYPIRVNSIHPGVIETSMIDSILPRYVEVGLAKSVEEQKAAFKELAPMGRMGRPEDIAGGVVFLCSPAASFTTGAELVIDGGTTA